MSSRQGGTSEDGERTSRVRAMAVAEAPKHTRLLQSARSGKALSAMMRPFYVFATPPGHAVLTTTGSKSGKPRRKCLRVVRRGDVAYLVMLRPPAAAIDAPAAVAAWVRNMRADPRVRLKLGRRVFSGIARELNDPAELELARRALCDTVHLVDYGECRLHLRGLPTRTKIKALHRYWFDTGIPIAIDLSTG